MQYLQTYPSSKLDSYTPNRNVTFLVQLPPSYEMIKGSLRIHGRLKVKRGANPIKPATDAAGPADRVYYDSEAGMHVLFDNMTTLMSNAVSESIADYARYVKMLEQINSNDVDRMTQSTKNIEGKTGDYSSTTSLLAGLRLSNSFDFAISPVIAINRSDVNITQQKIPQFEIKFKLQDTYLAFFGEDCIVANNISYTIEDLKLTYKVQPSQTTGNIMMATVSSLKNSIDSQTANIELVLPINTLNAATSVITLTNMNEPGINKLQTDKIAVSNLKYMFNDSNNKLVSFNINNEPEMLYLYSRALKDQSSSTVDTLRPAQYKDNYGFGLTFYDEQSAGNKVSIEVKSDANSNTIRYYAYTYMQGVIII